MIYLASPFRDHPAGYPTSYTYQQYAKRALRHSLSRGEVPIAPHLLYPQVLDDSDNSEHLIAINANRQLMDQSSLIVFYLDFGMSAGMQAELDYARQHHIPIDIRYIGEREAPAPVEAPPEPIAVPAMTPEVEWSPEGEDNDPIPQF